MANHTLNCVIYSTGQNTAENYTNVRVDVYLNRNSSTGAWWTGSCSGYVYLNGQRQDFSVNGYDCRHAQNTYLATRDFRVYHNSDGTKSFSWEVYFNGNNTAYVGAQTIRGNWTCPTIARAASISSMSWGGIENAFSVSFSSPSSSFNYRLRVSIPYVQEIVTYSSYTSGASKTLTQAQKNVVYKYMVDHKVSSVTLGFVIETYSGSTKIGESSEPTRTVSLASLSTLTTNASSYTTPASIAITIKRNNSKYTHKLYHKLNGQNLATTTPGTSETYTGVTSAVFGQKYPKNTSGSLQLVLETYYDSILIGSTSKTVTINLQSYSLPTPTLSLALVNDNTTVNGWGIYLKRYSKYKATITGAAGVYGSSISAYIFNGAEQSSNVKTSSVISTSGTLKVTAAYKDCRGKRSSEVSQSVTVYDYYNPVVSSVSASRYNGTAIDEEGTQVQIKASFSYASCNGKNAVTAIAYIKAETSSTWTSLGAITSGVAKVFTSVTLAINTVYQVKVTATDTLGNKTDSSVITITTASAIIDVLKGGTGAAIGKMASIASLFDIAWNTKINGNLTITGKLNNFTIGTGNTDNKNRIPTIAGDGVMEIGKYLDFHQGTEDYLVRLSASSGALALNGSTLIHAGNYGSYCASKSHNHDGAKIYPTSGSTMGGFQLTTTWIGLYDSIANAKANTRRKGWIGHNSTTNLSITNEAGGNITANRHFIPSANNSVACGMSSNCWTNVYAYNNFIYSSGALAINSTNDTDRVRHIRRRSDYLEFNINGSVYGVNMWASDLSLKNSISETKTNALATVNNIKLYDFYWNEGDKVECGVISQQLEDVKEDFVISVEDENGVTRLQPNDTRLIPYLIKSIQELSAKVDQLQNELDALKKEENK